VPDPPKHAQDNPSSWSHRLPVVGLAIVGCGLSVYLTSYQWHVLPQVWDPIFGSHSSEVVLSSFLSRYLPLPDATLGALAYAAETVLALIGGTQRYRTHPRLVLAFGLLLAGMAVVSLGLVAIQLFILHALCTLCLCSAAISWTTAWLSHDEILASLGEWLRSSLRSLLPEPWRTSRGSR